jgi:DNA-binding NtrC family response regulator
MTDEKILIVDDEKNVRLMLAQSLEPVGYQISTATNGEEALRLLEQDTFDLILSDLKMPKMNGMEFLHRVVDLHPEIRVVIISAYGTVSTAVEAMKLGATDFVQKPVNFLQKPFNLEEIREVVHDALERGAVLDYGALVEAARHCAQQRKFEQAMVFAKQAVGADPARPEALNLLGEIEEVSGDRVEALKKYRAAVNLDPTYRPAQQNLDRATTNLRSRPRFT